MNRIRPGLIAPALVAMAAVAASAVSGQSEVFRSAEHDYRLVTVADGFDHPWSMAWLPNHDMLVTERSGTLRIVRDGVLLPDPVPGVPEVVARGQGGLLEVTPHPDFADNNIIYLTYSKPNDERSGTTALGWGRFENDELIGFEDLFIANSQGGGHYGSKIAFSPDGYLLFTVGDRMASPSGDLEAHPAQDITNHHGTVNRLNLDGSIPEDNPFVDVEGAEPSIWSYGHRNMQGLVIDQQTGIVWLTEHGPQGGDEVNVIKPGLNYGWPVVGFGVNYRSGLAIHEGTHREGMEQPAYVWIPSIGASGMMLYTGDVFPRWKGNLFAGGLAGQVLSRFVPGGEEITFEESLVWGQGRLRDVRQGPDGLIYLAIESRGDELTPVVRLEPVER